MQGVEVPQLTEEIIDATAKPAHPDLPPWVSLAYLMMKYHWTERQIREEMSPAMLERIAFIDAVQAEADELRESREKNKAPAAPPPARRR